MTDPDEEVSAMAYATLPDINAKWTLTGSVVTARATVLLEEAGALLDSKRRTLAADVAAGTVSAVLARKVVTDAVIRVLANPAGVSSQTLGPEAVQYTGVRTLGTVAFTQDELDSLDPHNSPASVGGVAIGTAKLGTPGWLERERFDGMADATFVRPLVPDPQLLYADGPVLTEGN